LPPPLLEPELEPPLVPALEEGEEFFVLVVPPQADTKKATIISKANGRFEFIVARAPRHRRSKKPVGFRVYATYEILPRPRPAA